MASGFLRSIGPVAVLVTMAVATGCGNRRGKNDGWKYIVIHHSATAAGNAASFHHYHLMRGHGGLAYHFVIGNGHGSPDGAVETGFRWTDQSAGTACSFRAGEINRYSIAICLVGNFELTPPTPAQMRTLTELAATLRRRYGIPLEQVLGHREVSRESDPATFENTRCPGRLFDMVVFRNSLSSRAGGDAQSH